MCHTWLQEVTEALETPEVAFTGDTTFDWICEPSAADALQARLLILEVTFVDGAVSVAGAREKCVRKLTPFTPGSNFRLHQDAVVNVHGAASEMRHGFRACRAGATRTWMNWRQTPTPLRATRRCCSSTSPPGEIVCFGICR